MGRLFPARLAPRIGILVSGVLASNACQRPDHASAPAAPGASADAVAAVESGPWHGQHSRVVAATYRILRDDAAWAGCWAEIGQPAPRPPDWARDMAVAVFLGERRSGGYTVRIESVAPQDGKLLITCRESAPPRGTLVTQALTQPWAIAVVPRSDLMATVRFLESPAARPSGK